MVLLKVLQRYWLCCYHLVSPKFGEARGVFNKKSRTFVWVGQDFVSIFTVLGVSYVLSETPLACEAIAKLSFRDYF